MMYAPMMTRASSSPLRIAAALTFALALALALAGCGTAAKDSAFKDDFAPARAAKITLGEVTDISPSASISAQEDIDTEGELRAQLEAKLAETDLLADWSAKDEKVYVLNATIIDYDPGSAFGRWLWPGVGATELSVQCTLTDGDRNVGSVYARRTVEAGGFYTVGAWKDVFGTVADDIVAELKEKLGK